MDILAEFIKSAAIPADKLSGGLALLSVSDNSSSPSILKNGAASVSPDIAGIAVKLGILFHKSKIIMKSEYILILFDGYILI